MCIKAYYISKIAPLTHAPLWPIRGQYLGHVNNIQPIRGGHLGINTWHKPIRGQYLGHVNNIQLIRGRHLGHVVITILYILIYITYVTPGTLLYMISLEQFF